MRRTGTRPKGVSRMAGAILITGAGARVGAHFARELAKDGWAVAIHFNRSRDGATALKDDILAEGGTAVTVQANLCIPGEVDGLIANAAQALGQPITALINNASTFSDDRAESFTNAGFDHHFDVNLRAPLMLSQKLAEQLPDGFDGSIINMVDQRVLKPNPLYFTYSVSKSGLYWATKTLAQSLAPNVRVNAIGPGPTLQNSSQTDAEFAAEKDATLLGGGSPPDSLLDAVRYLLGATSVTGQFLAVDGGQHLTWKTRDLLVGV